MSLKGSITKADFLPFNEYQRLVHSLESEGEYRWALYCTLSFCFGLRVSDVVKLKWSDVLGRGRIIMEEQKTKKVKPIPIGQSAQSKITSAYQNLGSPKTNEYIFKNQFDGAPCSRQYLNRIVKGWKDKYQLPINNFSTHTFRKTFGRYVYESRGKTEESLILLMNIFRHSNLSITKRYIGLTDDEIGKVFQGIDL